jgi:hypothetical protein
VLFTKNIFSRSARYVVYYVQMRLYMYQSLSFWGNVCSVAHCMAMCSTWCSRYPLPIFLMGHSICSIAVHISLFSGMLCNSHISCQVLNSCLYRHVCQRHSFG